MPRNINLDSASKLRLRAADFERLAHEAKHQGVARELTRLAPHYLGLARRMELAQRLEARLRRSRAPGVERKQEL
jgi:hypothetical protein